MCGCLITDKQTVQATVPEPLVQNSQGAGYQIIHQLLQEDTWVTTVSLRSVVGKGALRMGRQAHSKERDYMIHALMASPTT